jgi:O-antigen/teichoic acid export membrane protein
VKDGGPAEESHRAPDERRDAPTAPAPAFRLRRLARNVSALLGSTVIERATSFILYAIVARSLGAADLGALALAIAVFQVVGKFAALGLPVLTTREVARSPERVGEYVVNGAAVVTVTSIVGYGALIAFLWAAGYSETTTLVIWAIFVGLIPYCWSQIAEATLIGLERANLVAAVNVPANIAQVILSYFLIQWGYGIGEVAFSIGVMYASISLVQLVLVWWRLRPTWVPPSFRAARGMVRTAFPFLGIEGVLIFRATSTTFIISLILGEAALGVYSAAVQLSMPLRLVGNVLGIGLFPALVRAHRAGVAIFREASGKAVELVISLVLPAAIGLVVTGSDLLDLVYGRAEFAESSTVLSIVVWAAFAAAAASILGRVLVSADQEVLTLRIAVVTTLVQIVLSVPLTSRIGVTGAAAAALAASLLNFAQLYGPLRRRFSPDPVFPNAWRPVLASIVMAITLLLLTSVPVLIRIAIGAAAYAISIVAISTASAGGWNALVHEWRLEVKKSD